ncbi:hypothetical protein EON62_00200 [archaeon]|nr:MAG: hypothetical protein EON62_00200 [archaeon]
MTAQLVLFIGAGAHHPTCCALSLWRAGIPTIGIVANAEFRYYTFTSTVDTNISVTLTALAGDPDIFLSTTTPQPSMVNYDWAGAGFMNEFVRIHTTDAAYVAPPGTYYISVYGWGATNSYSLVVTQEVASFPVRLLNGQPQAGRTLTSHSFRYYMYNVSQDLSTAQSIDFIATPLRGDVDLYISTVGAYNPASGFVEPVFPSVSCEAYMPDFPSVCASWVVNPYTYTWSSVNSQMVDYITVPTTTLSAGQMLIVGVLATTPDSGGGILAPVSTYVLTGASTDAWVDLQDGVPTAGIVVASGSKYYTLTLTAANVDIAISAHTTRGALDLYVSESDQHPSAGSSQWNATSSGGFVPFDNVYIPFGTLSGSCRLRLNFGLPCTLYIAAVGYSGMPIGTQCLYSITGSMFSSPSFPQTLVENSPSIAHITANTYQYFTTTASINAGDSMYAIVRDLSGTSQMWLVVGNNGTKTFASPQNNFQADAYSVDMGGYTRIIVTPTGIVTSADGKSLQQIPFVGASPYCTSCPIYITVGSGSSTAPADVAVSYVEGTTVTPLENDVASTGLVPTNGAAYFSFYMGQPSANLSITITPIWGAVDAYITVQSPSSPYLMPSNRTWLWQMHPSSGERTLVIPTTDPHFCLSADGLRSGAPCTFVIAVQGKNAFQSPYFDILATADTSNSFARVVDGKSIRGSAHNRALRGAH